MYYNLKGCMMVGGGGANTGEIQLVRTKMLFRLCYMLCPRIPYFDITTPLLI